MNFCNMKPFWYALYSGTVQTYDNNGYQNGTHATYSNPVKAMGNISPAKGSTIARQFGEDEEYDRVILVPDSNTPINEYAVLWVDTAPELDANGALKVNANGDYVTPWDYIVRKVARGLDLPGSANIAISNVHVSAGITNVVSA